jgi:hypothetical protein
VPRLASFTLALFVLPAVALAAGAPHDEQERLNRADMTLAKRAVVHKADLAPGWRRVRSRPDKPGEDQCSAYDPDLSAFVVTGKAETSFAHSAGGRIMSDVAVFPNARHAAGDFKASAKPGFLPCLRSAMMQGFREAHLRARITSSRMSMTPRVGAQSVSYRVTAMIYPTNGVPPFGVYADFLAFRKGRSQATFLFMAPYASIRNQVGLARAVARRMQ